MADCGQGDLWPRRLVTMAAFNHEKLVVMSAYSHEKLVAWRLVVKAACSHSGM